MDNALLTTRYRTELGFPSESKDDKAKRKCAFETAHDLRKFEIELIWKRSTYFWGLQIATFAGVAALSSSLNQSPHGSLGLGSVGFISILLLLLSVFGTCAAFAWFAVAYSSKVWMYNWEKHIDRLESEFSGDIYKTLYFRNDRRIFSLTGVNESIAIIACAIWVMVTAGVFSIFSLKNQTFVGGSLLTAVAFGLLLVVYGLLSPRFDPKNQSKMDKLNIPEKSGLFLRREI